MSVKLERRLKIKAHIRSKITGTAEKPRLTVFRSNAQIYVQIIDDVQGKTLVSASSLEIKDKVTKKEVAAKVGESVAKLALEAGIAEVVFDRNGFLYHGRVKELAEGARKGGLKL
ncbi:MAG: 50S ribosomal protein L18 [Paludibacteraceae bacterium]|nr:50S ribosomal protein L18 [Paludibacteraceae bacterium]